MTYDASDQKQIRLTQKAARLRERDHINFLVAAMSTPQGRLWFHDLLVDCAVGVDIPSFEPNRDYFQSGRRSIGLQIKALLEIHCPGQYLQMMEEQNARLAADAERARRQESRRSDFGSVEPNDADPDAGADLFDYPGAYGE